MSLYPLAEKVGQLLLANNAKLASAESCTGGWIAKSITDIAGSSNWFDCGFITYSNASKIQMLGVSSATLERYGAVSEQTVCEMAHGALQKSQADISVAVSGVAGPGGGTANKPVGLVCFAWGIQTEKMMYESHLYAGDRDAIRYQTVEYALKKIVDILSARSA